MQPILLIVDPFHCFSLIVSFLSPQQRLKRDKLLGSFFFPFSIANLFNTSRASLALPLIKSQHGDSDTKGSNNIEYARGKRDNNLYKFLNEVFA